MRHVFLILTFVLCAFGQQTPQLEVVPYKDGTPGAIRLYEQRSNGRNFAGFRAADVIAGNCSNRISDIAWIPCVDNQVDLGLAGTRFKDGRFVNMILTTGLKLGTGSTSGWVLTDDGAGNFTPQAPAGSLPVADTTNIVRGSVDATKQLRFEVDGFTPFTTIVATWQNLNLTVAGINVNQTWTATQSFQNVEFAADNVYTVGTTTVRPFVVFGRNADFAPGGTIGNYTRIQKLDLMDQFGGSGFWDVQSNSATNSNFQIRDNAGSFALNLVRNDFLGARDDAEWYMHLIPDADYGQNLGNSTRRWDQLYGRLVNLKSRAGSLALLRAFDAAGNLTFSMGDGGGTGGELQLVDSAGVVYFEGINGQLRANGSNGLTGTFNFGTCSATYKLGLLTGTSGVC